MWKLVISVWLLGERLRECFDSACDRSQHLLWCSMATHTLAQRALWPGQKCSNSVGGRFSGGLVRAQTEAWNIHPEPKKVLEVDFWQGLSCIVPLCMFIKDSCWKMKYLMWSFLWGVLKPFEFYFMESENCFGVPLSWLLKAYVRETKCRD